MKSKIYILLLLNIAVFQFSYSQITKEYIGRFDDGDGNNNKGIAKYQYYENENLERIFNGNFKYEYDNNYVFGYYGKYENGMKVGIWNSYHYTTNKEILYEAQGEIKNNTKNGKWLFKIKDMKSKKTVTYDFSFRNDTIINLSLKHHNFRIQTDSNGKIKDTIILKYDIDNLSTANPYFERPNYEVSMVIYDNVVIKYFQRRLSDGFIKEKFLPKKEEICSIVDNLTDDFELMSYPYEEGKDVYNLGRNNNLPYLSTALLESVSRVIKKTFWKGLIIPKLGELHFNNPKILTKNTLK